MVDRVRLLQLGFVFLLLLAVAQVVWWEVDQARYAGGIESRLRDSYQEDAEGAAELLRRGAPAREVERRWPHLWVVQRDGAPVAEVRAEALDSLRSERRHHLNQYLWEGGFFLVVLMAGGAVLWWGMRKEAELRTRQRNFLAAVSHELKTPIASLQLATETMQRRALSDERRGELLQRNLKDLGRLQRLVANLLEVPRLESGRPALQRAAVSLREAVQEVLAELERAGWERAAAVANRVPEGLSVVADPVGVTTVVRNLVENALKATSDGGLVRVSAAAGEHRVELSVEDDGRGFPPQESVRLFEMFYRPGEELRRRDRGTGLGLFLVQRFVGLEGGGVSAHSPGPGGGARFDVWWPVRELEEGA